MDWMLLVYFLFLLYPGSSVSKENVARQELIVIIGEEMESVNITCKFNHEIKSMYLDRTIGMVKSVLYAADNGKRKSEDSEYKNRTEYVQLNKSMARIWLKNLKKSDSDVYVCRGTLRIGNNEESKKGDSIILAVKGKENNTKVEKQEAAKAVKEPPVVTITKSSSSSWMLYALIFEFLLLVLALGYFILSRIDIKKYCKKGKGKEVQNTVYEDMTYSLKHNAMMKPNPYCTE